MTMRLVVLGYGFIADVHTRAAHEAGLEVVGVAGHDPAKAQAFAARHGLARATADWEALVTGPDVDGVVIGTPNSLHAPQALHALANGKHVLVEKPMATTVADGEAMVRAAEAKGRALLVGHMWRYRDEVRALRDRIASGELGRVVRTHGFGAHAGWGPSGWFTDPLLAGGGALIDMGIHAVDTVRFLLGDPQPRRVVASIGTAYGDYPVDDDAVLLVDWDDGVRSVIESGWWQPRLGGLEAETEVLGTKGWARIWPEAPAGRSALQHCSLPMFVAQMRDFEHACATGSVPLAGADAGLTALRVVEAAYASAADLVS